MLSSFIFFLLYLIIDMKFIDETLEKRPSISSDDFRHEGYNISLIVLCSYEYTTRK